MEYYNRLDAKERNLLQNYAERLNFSSSRENFTPLSTTRTNNSQRLPTLNSFHKVLSKPLDHELVPKPEILRKTRKNKSPKRKSSGKRQLNGKFYSEKGLDLKHPDLPGQIRQIFQLIDSHKLRCHGDLVEVDFSVIKKHFFS